MKLRFKCIWSQTHVLVHQYIGLSLNNVSRPSSFIRSYNSEPPKIMFFGTDNFAVKSLDALHTQMIRQKLIKELAVVTIPLKKQRTPVAQYAKAYDLPLHFWPVQVVPNQYDLGVVVSFGHLIPGTIISAFPLGMINLHASKLPRWRGAAPIIHTILNGDTETGVTVMKIEPKRFDVGEVVSQASCPVPPDASATSLTAILSDLGAKLLAKCVEEFPDCLNMSQPQSTEGVTYAPKITAEMAVIKWDKKSAEEVYNLYKAIHEIHQVSTMWQDCLVKLDDIIVSSEVQDYQLENLVGNVKPGHVYYHKKRRVVCIKCKVGWVGFRRVKVARKKFGTAHDFYNGYVSKVQNMILGEIVNPLECTVIE